MEKSSETALLFLLLSLLAIVVCSGYAGVSGLCIINLHYFADTATPTTGAALSPVGSMLAIRFTPPTINVSLVAVRFYIISDPDAFFVRIFDEKRQLLPQKWTLSPTSTGWVTLDIADSPLIFDRDFYVALEYLSPYGANPALGATEGNPSGRNYEIFFDGKLQWRPDPSDPSYNATRSYMIEAVFANGPFLTIVSPFAATTGQGCYKMGDTVEVTTPPSVKDGERILVFDGWTGDYSGNESSAKIKITKLETKITANYRTMYRLEFVSQFGAILNGSGWYDAGNSVSLAAPRRIWVIFAFDKMEGDIGSSSYKVQFTINRPLAIRALYQLDFIAIATLDAVIMGGGCVLWYSAKRLRARKFREWSEGRG
jgi:hypothetical protein